MSRRLTALSLFAAGALALSAHAQESQPPAEKKAEPKLDPPKTTVTVPVTRSVVYHTTKTVTAADAAIEKALANDPDVRMARAKIQLAEAELAKARQVATQKVVTLQSAIREQKKAVATAEEAFALMNAAFTKGQGSRSELLMVRDRLETAQAVLARSETELKLVTGDDGKAADAATRTGVAEALLQSDAKSKLDYAAYLLAAQAQFAKAATGPIPERIRAVLDKPVKLGAKGEKVTFDKALEAFKKVGLDVPVRNNFTVSPISSLGEELPVGAWFQMFNDETPELLFLVREYGLFITVKNPNNPTDAVSVSELWKRKPAAADAPKK